MESNLINAICSINSNAICIPDNYEGDGNKLQLLPFQQDNRIHPNRRLDPISSILAPRYGIYHTTTSGDIPGRIYARVLGRCLHQASD